MSDLTIVIGKTPSDRGKAMDSGAARGTTTEWEVWRTHAKGGPDIRVRRAMSEEPARELLAECLADEEIRGFCDFYLVKATVTREVA